MSLKTHELAALASATAKPIREYVSRAITRATSDIDERITPLEARIVPLEARIAALEARLATLEQPPS